jgi:hypothetical protein
VLEDELLQEVEGALVVHLHAMAGRVMAGWRGG